jgi:hypothetical protein
MGGQAFVRARCQACILRPGGLSPVLEVEALELARASASIDSHAFFAEQVANALFIGRYARPGGPEAISYVALDREHAIDVGHRVPLSAKPFADRLTTVLGGNASGFRGIPVRRPSSLW